MVMLIHDETKASCLELLASQRQELLVLESLTARHAEAVAIEQNVTRDQAALQHTAEASRSALVTAIHELGVWIQADTSSAPKEHTGSASEHTEGTASGPSVCPRHLKAATNSADWSRPEPAREARASQDAPLVGQPADQRRLQRRQEERPQA